MDPRFEESGAHGNRPCGAIWNDCPFEKIGVTVSGAKLFDDFANMPALTSASHLSDWDSFFDASGTINQDEAVNGVLQLYSDGTDNDSAVIQKSGATGAAYQIRESLAYPLWFEARFYVDSVADDDLAIFLGLAEAGTAVDNWKVDDTGVMVNKNWIGFDSVHTNGGTTGTNAVLAARYKADGQTQQTKIATLQTMVASTWYQVGFKYCPWAPATKRLRFYLDGAEQTTYGTNTNLVAATFPYDKILAPILGIQTGGGGAQSMFVDWIKVAQVTAQ